MAAGAGLGLGEGAGCHRRGTALPTPLATTSGGFPGVGLHAMPLCLHSYGSSKDEIKIRRSHTLAGCGII